MKFRTDFVTNSSSSSFATISIFRQGGKSEDCDELEFDISVDGGEMEDDDDFASPLFLYVTDCLEALANAASIEDVKTALGNLWWDAYPGNNSSERTGKELGEFIASIGDEIEFDELGSIDISSVRTNYESPDAEILSYNFVVGRGAYCSFGEDNDMHFLDKKEGIDKRFSGTEEVMEAFDFEEEDEFYDCDREECFYELMNAESWREL